MNKTEILQAAEIMRRAAEGEVVKCRKKQPLSQWTHFYQDFIPWDWQHADYRILDFPSPPPNNVWHNPSSLNATQVGVHEGWRLLLESEIDGGRRWDCEQWFAPAGWGILSEESRRPMDLHHKIEPVGVYRTKSPLPEVKADPMEEAWIVCGYHPHCVVPSSWKEIFERGWLNCKEHYRIP